MKATSDVDTFSVKDNELHEINSEIKSTSQEINSRQINNREADGRQVSDRKIYGREINIGQIHSRKIDNAEIEL